MRLLIVICMLLQIPAFAQEGTQFRELTFEQALAAAKEEGKLLFVDCYTSWCGPCKNMAENVFPQPEAGEYFNPRFVCVKYDMEKGEGPELAERFDVHAYPTFVIVRPDGTVQHKLVGGSGLEEFIARVEKGMNEQTSLLSLNEAYKRGGMDNATLMAYYSALAEADDDDQAAKVYAELWSRLTDEEKTAPEYWGLLANGACVIGTPQFDFLLAHLKELRENVGQEAVDNFVANYYWGLLGDHVMGYADEDTPAIETLERQVPTLGVAQQESLDRMLELASLVARQQADKLAALIEKRMADWDAGTLRTYAFGYRGIAWGDKGKGTIPADYKALGQRLATLTVGKMEASADTMTATDLQEYCLALSGFSEDVDDDTCRRIAAVGDKVLARQTDSPDYGMAKHYVDGYRKQSNQK